MPETTVNTTELPFWWSWQRQRRYDRCPRAYYYYYYGAAGGHESSAPPQTRELYRLKHQFNRHTYPVFAVKTALRELFYNENSGSVMLETAADRLLLNFKRHWEAMLDGRCDADPGLPFLRELADETADYGQICHDLSAALRELGEKLESGTTGEILRTPLTARRILPRPFTVQLGELCCFAEPVLALVKNGEMWFLDGGAPNTELRGAASALIFRQYAMTAETLDPDRVRVFQLDMQTGVWGEFGSGAEVGAAREYVLQSAALLLGKVSGGTACEADFPPAPENGCCKICRFAGICRNESSASAAEKCDL